MFKGKISIIVPVYNVAKYLEKCIDSIVSQTYSNTEIILVDDGSTDNSGKICDKYAEIDSRIIVIHKKNSGLSDTRNVGIRTAKGEYCTFIDSDDFYEDSGVIERLAQSLCGAPDFLMFWFKRCNEDATEVWEYYKKVDLEKVKSLTYSKLIKYLSIKDMFLVSACCKLVRTSLLTEKNLYFEKGLIGEDIDWFLKLVNESAGAVCTNESGYIYRIRRNSITHRKDEKPCTDLSLIIQKWAEVYIQHKDRDLRSGVLSFLAYEYYILLGNKKVRKLELTEEERELKKLVKYSRSKKTILCMILYIILGEKTAGKIFAAKITNGG